MIPIIYLQPFQQGDSTILSYVSEFTYYSPYQPPPYDVALNIEATPFYPTKLKQRKIISFESETQVVKIKAKPSNESPFQPLVLEKVVWNQEKSEISNKMKSGQQINILQEISPESSGSLGEQFSGISSIPNKASRQGSTNLASQESDELKEIVTQCQLGSYEEDQQTVQYSTKDVQVDETKVKMSVIVDKENDPVRQTKRIVKGPQVKLFKQLEHRIKNLVKLR